MFLHNLSSFPISFCKRQHGKQQGKRFTIKERLMMVLKWYLRDVRAILQPKNN